MNVAQFETYIKRRYGNQYRRLRGGHGAEFAINCPFCVRRAGKVDVKKKLHINPEHAVWRCWRCNSKGRLDELFTDIAREQEAGPAYVVPEARRGIQHPGELIDLGSLDDNHVAVRYIRRRGYDPSALSRVFGIKYCSVGQKFMQGMFDTTNTIVFPVWMQGQIVGWQARLLYDPDQLSPEECLSLGFKTDEDGRIMRPPKYFTPSGFDKGKALFNYDVARTGEVVVVCEGPLDATSVGPLAVGTFGKSITAEQARLIKPFWKLAVVMLDPGDADAESQSVMLDLAASMRVIQVRLEGYKDPGDAPTLEIWRQIDAVASRYGIDLGDYDLGRNWDVSVIKTVGKPKT